MPANRFVPGCCDCPTPAECTAVPDAKWKGAEAYGDDSTFSIKWLVFACWLTIDSDVPPTADRDILLVWDSDTLDEFGAGTATYVRARSNNPTCDITAVFDVIPRDDWEFGNPGPGNNDPCLTESETTSCGVRYAWWLLQSIEITYGGDTYVFNRAADTEDEYGQMEPEGDYCLTFHGNPIITRRIFDEADYATLEMTYEVADLAEGGDAYACDNGTLSGSSGCVVETCECGEQELTLVTGGITTLWDGFYLGARFPAEQVDCGCCDGDDNCLRTVGNSTIGYTDSNQQCGGVAYAVFGVKARCDGDDPEEECPRVLGGGGWTSYIPCNDKHPLYDVVTADEWEHVLPDTAEGFCCGEESATITIEEVV